MTTVETKNSENKRAARISAEARARAGRRGVSALVLAGAAAALVPGAAQAQAQVTQAALNLCAGVAGTLPTLTALPATTVGSVGTLPVLGTAALPTLVGQTIGTLDTAPLTASLNGGLNTVVGNVNNNVVSQLSGRPLTLNGFDIAGNPLALGANVNCSAALLSPTGITVGGGRIDGLGGPLNTAASTGDSSAVAIGNGSVTGAGLANAIAFGTNASASGVGATALGAGASATQAGAVALGTGSVANRLNGATEAFTGTGLRTTIGVVSVGSTGNERQITNVAGGSADTDAVNVRQLRGTGTNLATSLGGGAAFDQTTGAYRGPGYVIGSTTYTDVGSAIAALQTGATPIGPGLVVQANPTAPITVGAATGGTVVNIAGTGGNRVLTGVAAGSIAAGSTDAVNGDQIYTLSRSTVQYDTDPVTGGRSNTITLAGGDPNTPVVIRNVAPGVANTDAANVGQVKGALQEAKAYTDQQIASALGNQQSLSQLGQEIRQVRREARQAAAVGLASGSLRYDNTPGKISMAAGGGTWAGEAGFAFGMGYTTPDGLARMNASAATSDGRWGVGAGLSVTLN